MSEQLTNGCLSPEGGITRHATTHTRRPAHHRWSHRRHGPVGRRRTHDLGQQLTTGAQAKAWADHYIKVHLDESTGGKTYSELSAAARANPDDAKAKGLVELAVKGETLRGLLLNDYDFGTMGTIAMYAAWAAFAGAAAMLGLALLGFLHLRRVPAEEEVIVGQRRAVPSPAIA